MSGLDSVCKCEDGLREGAFSHTAKPSFGNMRSHLELRTEISNDHPVTVCELASTRSSTACNWLAA